MGEKVVKRDNLFQGMTEEEIKTFNELLPFEDDTPIERIKEQKNRLPKEQQEIIEQICKRQYDRRVKEIVELDKKAANKQLVTGIKRLILSFLKTPVAKLMYVVILVILLARLLGW